MEVDERLRWLESRISSSLRPRGEELRNFFADEENRATFLAFCNHSESRRIFIHLSSNEDGEEGQICVGTSPPKSLSDKSLFFLKCGHASKLSRESISEDVVYSECSRVPLDHLELVMKEVYLPLMSLQSTTQQRPSSDKLLDLMHRMVGAMQVTKGYSQGKVILPMPSIEVLAEAAMNSDRRAAVVHVLESSVVSWMKQVKMALHLDCNAAISKTYGKYPGPLAELEMWSRRLASLESVRDQMDSVPVLNILHSLEQAHSTYAQAFIHVHRDIGKAIVDTEHCLVYLNTLRPWVLQLHQAYSSDTLLKLFPPLLTTLSLVWQYSGLYSTTAHFQRILQLMSNKVMLKAKNIVGDEIIDEPEISLLNLKLALRLCAAFRGCYLDYREKSEVISLKYKERLEEMKLQNDSRGKTPNSLSLHSRGHLCSWPPRNSSAFSALSSFMERCNDLLELIQTVQDFRELEAAAYGVEGSDSMGQIGDPVVADIYSEFTGCLEQFTRGVPDLLNLDPESKFEEYFFSFRSTVKTLERHIVGSLVRAVDSAPSLPAQLRVLEMFQGISKRDCVKTSLSAKLEDILFNITSDVEAVSSLLSTAHPPPLPLTPPTACKLIWLNALKERVCVPMEKLREVAPETLEGDSGWKLRQVYGKVVSTIESLMSSAVSDWCESVPLGLQKSLRWNVLTRDSSERLIVNFDPKLEEVLSEIRHLKRSPLNIRVPSHLSQLAREVDPSELRHRRTSLQVVVQTYNELRESLSEVKKNLLLHKLQQTEQLLCVGVDQLDWTSVAFPDFIAKSKAMVCMDLQSTLNNVHHHTNICVMVTQSWSKVHGLDVFSASGKRVELKQLESKNREVLESLQSCVPPSVQRISARVTDTFHCIDEASLESPAWTAYLRHIDTLVLSGLKQMALTAIASLLWRANQYEQGTAIRPIVTVNLELQASDVQFSPPLSVHSALVSVPEAVEKWIDEYMGLAKLVPRLEGPGDGGSFYEALCGDTELKGAVSKISAHLETNARHCQSLRKRFTIYSFLWEQDVSATFSDFLHGQTPPHPRRFTRPETVRSRASARVHSGRPHSSSQSQSTLPTNPDSNLLGVMGVSDWDFLRPPYMEAGEDEGKRPSLDDFDGEIAVFQGVLDRLGKIEDISDVGWVCVDQRPVKQALSSLASKWKHVYASHLERQIGNVLSALNQFFLEVEPEVECISGEESDTQSFMKLMNIFNKVNKQQVKMDTQFGAVHRAVLILDKFECPISPTVRAHFNAAPQRWSNLKKRVALGKQRVGPRIQANGDIITQDLTRFKEIFSTLRADFLSSQCLRHDCSKEEAATLTGAFLKRLKSLQTQAQDLIELQELLESSVFNFSLLKEFEEDLGTLQDLWKLTESILELHSSWHSQHWTEVDSSVLLTHAENQLDLLAELPRNTVSGWNLYQHTHTLVTVAQSTAPILEELKSPSMRPRHWKQVLKFAKNGSTHVLMKGSSFDVNLLEELTFGQLLEMQLHNVAGELHAIVVRANKDVSIESLLNTFEEVWLSKHFELKLHQRMLDAGGQEGLSELAMGTSSNTPKSRGPSTRVTSGVRRVGGGHTSVTLPTPTHAAQGKVPLLCHTGGIFETLENHQTSLQSLEGTVAAASFSDELQKWHKQLQTIEAVLRVWLKVQLLWVQLEEVYGSSEVTVHLPSEAYTFATVDCEWRELMSTVARNTAVIAVCLNDGLLLSLEKLHSSLVQCQTALVRYVASQRLKCPWFHFLPLEDILQFMCYGSSLDQLSANIHKLLPHASGLVFNEDLTALSVGHTPSHAYTLRGGMHQNRISGIMSLAGERLDLIQGVQCEGPVDVIISKLMSSISSTLQSQLSTALTKYTITSPSHKQTPLDNLPSIWKSSLSTQIVLLATQIALEMVLSKATQSGATLTEFLAEVKSLSNTASNLLRGRALSDDESGVRLPGASAQSQVNMESNVALMASLSNVENGIDSSLFEEGAPVHRTGVSKHRLMRLQSVQLVLRNYKLKAEQLSALESSSSLSERFEWQSLLHFEWSSREQRSLITSLDTRLGYGYQHTGSAARLVLTPLTERTMYSMLRAIESGGGALLTGDRGVGRSSLVHELAITSGRLLFTVRCSPQTDVTGALEAIRGMSDTGSWLFLHSLDMLAPSVLQRVCSLLIALRQARLTHSTDSTGGCFATLSLPSQHHEPPSTLLRYFQTSSVGIPDRKVILEALFLVSEFITSQKLAASLDRVCLAVDELYSDSIRDQTAANSPFHFSLHKLKAIVLLAEKHLKEFQSLGLLSSDGEPAVSDPLKMPSIVYSEVSQSTRASLKFRMSGEESGSQLMTQQSLEEFALVLALKDTLFPVLSLDSKEHQIMVSLISELFPGCDLRGLLAYEVRVREELALKAQSASGAEESARESRAASAMQTVIDDNQTSEVEGTLEEQIIQSCQIQQLVPTVGFQTAVSQLVSMVQLNRFVLVNGPSFSGKTSVIHIAADTLTHMSTPLSESGPISLTTLAVGALREEQLLGYQDTVKETWVDGLLTHCLSSQRGKPCQSWLILEGALSPTQLDSLLACETGPHPSLVLTNGRSLPIDPSVRFLLEMTSLSSLTPSTPVRAALLTVSGHTVTWPDLLTRWFNTQPDSSLIRRQQASLRELFDKYLPDTLEFMKPALLSHSGGECGGVSTSTIAGGASLCRLQAQELRLSEAHVIQTLCTVLQCVLSELSFSEEVSSESLERALVYAIIWSLGGFLNSANKEIFDRWWRDAHSHSNHFPEDGLLWEYYLSSDLSHISPCAINPVPVTSSNHPSFVPTIHVQSYHHLLSLLLKQGSPVLLNGRTGSGKTSLLLNYLDRHYQPGSSDTALLHLYVDQGTCAQSLWRQVESHLEWRWGRRYTPKEAKKLLCFVDDLHNTQDKSASEFVRQHISSGVYHDPTTGKTHNISDMSYVVTTCLDSQHKQLLEGRLLKHFTVLHWDGYSSEQVSSMFGCLLSSKLGPGHASADIVPGLVNMAVQVHRRVESMFLATSDRLHYIFSLNNVASIFRSLCIAIEASTTPEAVDLLNLWQRTSWWVYAGLMSSEVDRERYWEVVSHSLRKYFNQNSKLPQLLSETSARLPGAVVEQTRQRLAHQLEEYNSTHPSIHINLYDTTVEEITYIRQVLSSPHHMGQLLLLGHTHPEPLIQLAALHLGHCFTQPSHLHSPTLLSSSSAEGISPNSYKLENLKKDLVHTYTVAGVKNEKMVLLLSQQEILHEDFLMYVYQFVKGGAISPLFSMEEQSRIVTAVRSDVVQSGLAFTVETAWDFFLKRVRDNVRMVLSLPRLTDKLSSGSRKWQDMLGSLRVYTHLPWERKELVDVTTHHLTGCGFLPDRQSESLAHLLASVHLQLRKRVDIHHSNSTYEYFTERFVHELQETHRARAAQFSLVSSALECVSTAKSRAKSLEEKIGREEIILREKEEACVKLLIQIGQDTAILKQHSRLLGKQRERIAHLKKVIPEFEYVCDLSLQEKAAIVASSQQLVLNMDQAGLCELRTQLRPPEEVEELLVAVISVIKGPTADKTWTKGAKRLMANLDRFCELLTEFGACEESSEIVLEALDPLMHKPTFTPEHFTQYTGGVAASQLCSWIGHVHSLHSTLQSKIRPLQSKVSTMQASLNEYTDRLRVQESKIRVLDVRLAGLSSALENASVEKSRERDLVRSTKRDCQYTSKFIETLSPVHEVWSSQSTDVMKTLSRSIGSCCLSVCLAVYLSSLPPHLQLEIINTQIIPVVTLERGVELVWPHTDQFLSAFVIERDETAATTARKEEDTPTPPDCHAHKAPHVESYSMLSKCLISTLVPQAFSDHWISACHSLSQLLSFSLIESSWRRWPLVYDPQGVGGEWVRSLVGEPLVILDGTDRSPKFYQCLEEAMVNGGRVLVEQFPCSPPDPSLYPLLALRHDWKEGLNVVQLCGHRLHVHPSFKLYLTTSTPPTSLPAILLDLIAMISCDISQAAATDQLLSTAMATLGGSDVSEEIKRTCMGVTSCKAQLEELNQQLFEQLPCRRREPVYRVCTEKFSVSVNKKKEVSSELEAHFTSLCQLFVRRSRLLPLAQHAATAHALLQDCTETAAPHSFQSWVSFTEVFKSSLDDHRGSMSPSHDEDTTVKEALHSFNKCLLQDTLKYLDSQRWTGLACSLTLLSLSRPSSSNVLLLTDQLEYLSDSWSYIEEAELSVKLPVNPDCLSLELWQTVHKLPLPVAYFRRLLQSMDSHSEFWDRFHTSPDKPLLVTDFPWHSLESDSSLTGLEDRVVLQCVHEESSVQALTGLVSSLTDSVTVPTLSDVCEMGLEGKRPLLFYHDAQSQASQINQLNLETVLKTALKDRSLQVVKMGAGLEEVVSEMLTKPTSDCLLVEDLQYAPQHWVELLPQHITRAVNAGCHLVFTTTLCHAHLPRQFVQSCHVSLLSKLATVPSLPGSVCMAGAMSHKQLLRVALASIPKDMMSKISQIQPRARTLVYNLALLHVITSRLSTRQPSLLACSFTSLLCCLSSLVAMGNNENVVLSLEGIVREVYSGCVPGDELERVVSVCMSEGSCVPGARLAMSNEEFTVPGVGVDPARYVDQVSDGTGDNSPHISWDDISDGIEVFLLPLLSRLPTHISTPSTPLSPSHPSHPHTTRSFMATLDYIRESLPGCVESCGSRCGDLSVCSQLLSNESYHHFRAERICESFNDKLLTIRDSDIPTLTHYSQVEFNSLPSSLTHTLRSIQCGLWPQSWRLRPTTHLLSLTEGVQELREFHEKLYSELS